MKKIIAIGILGMFLLTSLTVASAVKINERMSKEPLIKELINPMIPRNYNLPDNGNPMAPLPKIEKIKPIWYRCWNRLDYDEEVDPDLPYNDQGWDIAIDEENGYIYTSGRSWYNNNGELHRDNILLQYDLDGNYRWHKIIVEKGDIFWGSCPVCIDKEGFVYISYVNDNYDIALSKYDCNGNEEWSEPKVWHGGEENIVESITVSDGYLYLTGFTSWDEHAFNFDIFLLKYDTDGNLQWDVTWNSGGPGELIEDWGWTVAAEDGFIYVGGFSAVTEPVNNLDIFLLKYDTHGILQWEKTWDRNQWDVLRSMVVHDGYLYITGETGLMLDWDVFLLKYDLDGNQVWSEPILWGEYDSNWAWGITIDDEYIFVAGEVRIGTQLFKSGVLLLKYDLDGNIIFSKIWPREILFGWNNAQAIESFDGSLYFAGGHQSGVLLLKCNHNGGKKSQSSQQSTTTTSTSTTTSASTTTSTASGQSNQQSPIPLFFQIFQILQRLLNLR